MSDVPPPPPPPSPSGPPPAPETSLPQAAMRPARRPFLGCFWVLPATVLATVAVVVFLTLAERGVRVLVHFNEGHGLKPGDSVRCRGIIVGEVRSVELAPDLKGVDVGIDLRKTARGMAAEGSRFWIVRPQADLTGVAGLDTAVGGKYVAVLPGEGKPLREFVGKETPELELPPGGLEIVVQDRRLGGLRPGAPLTYRGVRIGSVTASRLASDASAVEVFVYVLPAYSRLVRLDSVFWNVSGFKVGGNLLLGRLGLDFESAETVLAGGMAMATPTKPGPPARDGARFRLDAEPDRWQDWTPSIPPSDPNLPEGVMMPRVVKGTLNYSLPGRLFGTRPGQRRGLLIPVDGEWLFGPDDLLNVPADAAAGSKGDLVFEGTSQPVGPRKEGGPLRWLKLTEAAAREAVKGSVPAGRLRPADRIEDCLLVAEGQEPLFVSASHLSQTETGWGVNPTLSGVLSGDHWHGAAAVSVKSGNVIGVLQVPDKGPMAVIPLTAELLRR